MKKKLAVFLCALFCALLILFNPAATSAAKEGFSLWRDSVMPALLPFFVCTSLLFRLGALEKGSMPALFFLAFVSGAPGGAKLLAAYAPGEEPDAALSRLAAALNTVSPMFVAGAFAADMLSMPGAALPMLLAQLLAALTTVLLLRKAGGVPIRTPEKMHMLSPMRCLAASIREAVASVLCVLGAIVFFFTALCLMRETGLMRLMFLPLRALFPGEGAAAAEAVFSGMLEVTAGAKAVSALSLPLRTKAALGAFLTSFGGLCIAAQSLLFLPLKLKAYLRIKLFEGALAGILCYLLFPLCCFRAAEAGAMTAERLAGNALTAGAVFAVSLLAAAAVMLYAAVLGRRCRRRR